MDWTNINRDRDTSGLGPIEYDQSKVPPLIRKHADNVRTKTYGQEVREAQARNAELAGLIASEADQKATNSDTLSKDTQNRFKDQIEGTTNSDEVIDARRPFGAETAFKTLGERLAFENLKHKHIVNLADFGAIGDGETDDTEAIQRAIDHAVDNSTIIANDRNYLVSSPLLITKDNITVDGNGADFYWNGTENLGGDNWSKLNRGVFEFVGTKTDTESIVNRISSYAYGTKLELGTVDMFEKGDIVMFTARSGADGRSYDTYLPDIYIATRVVDVDENGSGILIDYVSNFNFDKFNWTTSKVEKLDVVQNPVIQNLNIYDLTDPAPESIAPSERGGWVNGAYFEKTQNPKIRNVQVFGHKAKAYKIAESIYGSADDIYAGHPQAFGGGAGYGMQINNSQKFAVYNFKGDKNRHLIDFTQSAHIDVYSSYDNSSLYGSFDCHGFAEHDITFTNCQGSWIFGNGIGQFACVTENISLVNCNVSKLTIHFVHNLKIDNSKIKEIAAAPAVNTLKITNTEIELDLHNNIFYVTGKNRGYFDNNDLILSNLQIVLRSIGANMRSLYFRDFDTALVSGLSSDSTEDNFAKLGFKNIDKVIFGESVNKNIAIGIAGKLSVLKMYKNTFRNNVTNSVISNGSQFIDLDEGLEANGNLYIFMEGNDFNSILTTRWIRVAAPLTGNITMNTSDNYFSGPIYESVQGPTFLDQVTIVRNVNRDFNSSTDERLENSKILNTHSNFNY